MATLVNLGNIYSNLQKYLDAINCYQKALSIAQDLRYVKGQSNILCNIGVILMNMKRYSEALVFLQDALKTVSQISFPATKALIIYNLATLHHNLGNLDKANEYSMQAEEIATRLDD